jgi:hypothetical protein
MVMLKLRQIATQPTGDPVMGLTVPNQISIFFEQTHFYAEKSGTSIVFTSGTKHTITKQQVENYNYEDCRIE